MSEQSLRATFDQDAERYDRARPGYPESLLDDLARQAGLGPGSRVLEIGPGTGQATVALAARGLDAVAVEFGASLAGVLRRRTTGLPVEVVVGAFEEQPAPPRAFDAVTAFTAWHWLDPGVRLDRVLDALRPGGTLATVTTTHVRGGTVPFFAEAQGCYRRWDPVTPADERLLDAAEIPPARDEIDDSDRFEPARRFRYRREVTYSTESYLDLLMTYSGHRALAPDRQAGLFACLSRLIQDRYQGSVTKRYLYELRTARRRDVG